METKTCTQCSVSKPLDNFLNRTDRPGKRRSYCNTCAAQKTKSWRSSNTERAKEASRKWRTTNNKRYQARQRKNYILRTYNISIEEYESMYKDQNGLCAICEVSLDETRSVVDHDHSTGAVRGVLCGKCNTGIGMLNDDYKIVQRALEYLKPDEE